MMTEEQKRQYDLAWEEMQRKERKKEYEKRLHEQQKAHESFVKSKKAECERQLEEMEEEDREYLQNVDAKHLTEEDKIKLQNIHTKYFLNEQELRAFRKSAVQLSVSVMYSDCLRTNISRVQSNFKTAFGGSQIGTMKDAVKKRVGKGDEIRQEFLQLVEQIERSIHNANRGLEKLIVMIMPDYNDDLAKVVYNWTDKMQDLVEAVYVRTLNEPEKRIDMMLDKVKKYKVTKGFEGIFE